MNVVVVWLCKIRTFDCYDQNDRGRMVIGRVFASGAVIGHATTQSWSDGRSHSGEVSNPTTAPDAKEWSIPTLTATQLKFGNGQVIASHCIPKITCSMQSFHCPACRTSLIATRFWVVVICPIIKCLTVLEFSFILFDLCLFITIFNFILNCVPIVTFWKLTYHKIWILLIIFCFKWNYWIIYFLTCLEVFWSVVS